MPIDKRLLYALAAGLVVFVGLTVYSRFALRDAQEARAQADVLAGRNSELEGRIKVGMGELAAAGIRNEALEATIADLIRKRPKAPPREIPVPVTDEELTTTLLGKGLSEGLRIVALPSSTFNPFDARKAYSWEREASRVPGFELKSASDDLIVAEQGLLIGGLKSQIAACNDIVNVREHQIGIVGSEVGELRKANDALLKVQVAERWKTRIKLGVGIPVAAYLGWRIGRK